MNDETRPPRRLGSLQGRWTVPEADALQEVLSPAPEFEVFRGADGQYRWDFTAFNGAVAADSAESYATAGDAERAVSAFRRLVATEEASETQKVETYQDLSGGYRWRLAGDNGQIIAASGEGYATREACERAAETTRRLAPTAGVVRGPE